MIRFLDKYIAIVVNESSIK